MATRRPFWKWPRWKSIGVCLWPPCHLQSPETEKSNMAARRPFWKWRCWKSIGSYPYTKVLCRWSLKLIFKAKVKLESGNQKIQYGRQAAILKVTSLKINRLLPMATINMHMKFEIEIPKQTWLMLRKPCRLQTDGRTDGLTDGRTRWIQYTPSNFVGQGYNDWVNNHETGDLSSYRPHYDVIVMSPFINTQVLKLQWPSLYAIWNIKKRVVRVTNGTLICSRNVYRVLSSNHAIMGVYLCNVVFNKLL